MNYTEIEIDGMKEILKDKEEEINRLNYIIRHNESREEGWKTYVKKFNDCMKDYKDLVKEYGKLEEENRKLKEELEKFNKGVKAGTIIIGRQGEEIRKLKNSIAYRKKKADKNQEKANQIDNIMKLPGVMRDGKINRISVARYYLI